MLNDCEKNHEINYSHLCCYKHLILMYNHSETHLLQQKFANLFLKTLNHFFKLNQLEAQQIKFENLKIVLDIISKVNSHFYFQGKYLIIF
jgi:hypothetical protein